jgi:serine/threonine protein kinase
MSSLKEFQDLVSSRYDPLGYTVEVLGDTSHFNVLKLTKGEDVLVAKGIAHVEGDEEMGPEQMDVRFHMEKEILQRLPSWWGLKLRDSFRSPNWRILVTEYVPHCSWSTFQQKRREEVAWSLWRQLKWLREQGIAHNDLELKNVLLSCDSSNAILMDFEKATFTKDPNELEQDAQKLLRNMEEKEELQLLAKALRRHVSKRRYSVGGKHQLTKKRRFRKMGQHVSRKKRGTKA